MESKISEPLKNKQNNEEEDEEFDEEEEEEEDDEEEIPIKKEDIQNNKSDTFLQIELLHLIMGDKPQLFGR